MCASESDLIAVSVLVEGCVQGVGFRNYVYKRAVNHELVGYVRNRMDGDVELEAVGSRIALDRFLRDVKCGPRMSVVTSCSIKWKSLESVRLYIGFNIEQ